MSTELKFRYCLNVAKTIRPILQNHLQAELFPIVVKPTHNDMAYEMSEPKAADATQSYGCSCIITIPFFVYRGEERDCVNVSAVVRFALDEEGIATHHYVVPASIREVVSA
jgi:hypothetical protein